MASHIVSRRFLAVSAFITRRLFDRHFSWKVLGAFLVVVSGNDDVGTMEISERLFACFVAIATSSRLFSLTSIPTNIFSNYKSSLYLLLRYLSCYILSIFLTIYKFKILSLVL